MNKVFFCALLLIGGFAQAKSVTICDPNSSASITFEVTGKKATMANDGVVVAEYSVLVESEETQTEEDLNEAIGEAAVSYTVFTLVDVQTKIEDVLIVANTVSGAKHLVLLGPMSELVDLGSTADCK